MTTRVFTKAPATVPLLLKAALPGLPLVGSLPGIKHASGSAPALVLQRHGVTTDPQHLDTYNEVCGFPRSDVLPPTYPHLAAFGLHMTLMTDTSFPFAPMGLVHLRNSITQHRPIGTGERLDISVHAADRRPHPKGSLIDLVTTVSAPSTGSGQGADVVWEETMTLFARQTGGAPETSPAPLAGVEAPEGVVHWKLKSDLGRRYGAISGDRNPIHLHPLTAKAFGFPTTIAHGMWALARSLAAVQNKLPDAFTNDVEFRKPILLPSTVVFGSSAHDGVLTFGVKGSKKPITHLVGRVR